MLEESDIVGGALNPGDHAGLVVELDAGRSHMMADPGALDERGEIVAEFAGEAAMELMAQEHGHITGLDDMDRGAHDGVVERLEMGLLAEDHIGGIFNLHQAPVIAGAELAEHWDITSCPLIQTDLELLAIQGVREFLSTRGIGNGDQGVIRHREGDVCCHQLPGQPGVAVEIDLQPERCPSGDTHVAQPEGLIDTVEVVVQAFAGGGLERGMMSALVVPGLEGRTGLHGGKNMDQPRMVAAGGKDLLDPILLAKGLGFADEFDLDPSLGGELFGIDSNLLPPWFGPVSIIKQADLVIAEISAHSGRMADIGQCAGNHHPVKAGQRARDFILMLIDKGVRHGSSPSVEPTLTIAAQPCLVPARPGWVHHYILWQEELTDHPL